MCDGLSVTVSRLSLLPFSTDKYVPGATFLPQKGEGETEGRRRVRNKIKPKTSVTEVLQSCLVLPLTSARWLHDHKVKQTFQPPPSKMLSMLPVSNVFSAPSKDLHSPSRAAIHQPYFLNIPILPLIILATHSS